MTFIQDNKQAAHLPRFPMSGGACFAMSGQGTGLEEAPPGLVAAQDILAERNYAEIEAYITAEDSAFWCFMQPRARPSFTRELLAELLDVQKLIARLLQSGEAPFSYVVLGGRAAGVFSLGGDLTHFAEKIRDRDREGLRRYAHDCVAVGYANYSGYGNGAMTIALLQGDALGGGFESALSCDMLVAERQVKFGLPEILFNLYPGMGAYSFLSRRVGMLKAEEIILSGRTYTAEEMLALGAIDMVVETGEGERAVRQLIERNRPRQLALSAVHKVRRRVNPVSLEELIGVTDLWVDTAMRLSEQDLRRMCRISAAQDRLRDRTAARLAAE